MENSNWDELIFAGRNQQYGAYDLRKAYSKRVTTGFVGTLVVMTLFIASPFILAALKGEKAPPIPFKPKDITEIISKPIIQLLEQQPKQVVKPVAQKFVAPKPTTEPVVEDKTPTLEDLKQVEVAVEGPIEVPGTAVEVTPVVEAPPVTYTSATVEFAPQFPGGMEALMKYIGKNVKYPAIARRLSVEGKVYVSFVIDENGNVVEVQSIKGIGSGCDEEAVRVMAGMPSWTPGRQGNKAVRVKFVLPLKFEMND